MEVELSSLIRRTPRTAKAYEHLPIVPGTDAWLLCGLLNTLFDEGLVDPRGAAAAEGVDALQTAIAPYTPERAATHTSISAAMIRQLARDFAAAPSAAAHGRLGICRSRIPTLTNYLLDALNVVTGNFDRRGGVILGTGFVDWATMMARMGRSTMGLPDRGWGPSRGVRSTGVGDRRGDRHARHRSDQGHVPDRGKPRGLDARGTATSPPQWTPSSSSFRSTSTSRNRTATPTTSCLLHHSSSGPT